MKIEYHFDEDDFLNYQLFTASMSETVRRRRFRSKVIVPLVYVALAVFLYFLNNVFLAISFAVIAILWFFLFPFWDRVRYVKYYRKYIQENFSQRLGRKCTLEFEKGHIVAKDEGAESRIKNCEIKEINEIPQAFYIKLKSGPSFILPKEKTKNIAEIRKKLKTFSGQQGIAYLHFEHWKWK